MTDRLKIRVRSLSAVVAIGSLPDGKYVLIAAFDEKINKRQ